MSEEEVEEVSKNVDWIRKQRRRKEEVNDEKEEKKSMNDGKVMKKEKGKVKGKGRRGRRE